MAFSNSPRIPQEGLVLLLDGKDVNSARSVRAVEVMVVGGGGGGGMDMGGGGGGGGVIYEPNYRINPGQEITVTVGAGGYGAPAGGTYRTDGAGPQPGGHQFTVRATNGGDSVFGNIVAKGGGYGASSYYGYLPDYGYGGTGASGGGCSGYTHGGERYVDSNNYPGQGFPGGNSGNPASGGDDHYSGGGGGAGTRGTSGPNHSGPNGTRGHGGDGVIIPRMSPYWYGGGGGGAGYSGGGGNGGKGGGGGGADCSGAGVGVGDTNGRNNGGTGGSGCYQPGGNGGANTGGGGGGGSHYNSNNKGGEGGSGIVIVRYNGPQAASGGTYTYENGVSYHTFTSNGVFTPFSNPGTWYDSSGKDNHTTLSNGPVWNSSGYFTFDGTNDYGTVSTFTGKPTAQITCEAWIKPSRTVSTGTVRGGVISSTNSMYLGIFDSADGGLTHGMHWANQTTNSRPYNINGSIPNNAWSHLVGTYDGATSRAYINGVEVWSSAQTGTIPDGTYVIGTYGPTLTDVTHNFQGLIGTVKIYNRALSVKEILQSYNTTKTRFGL